MSRPIAVLGGTGPEGLGLALRWAQAGETVIIGSRDLKRAQDAAAKIKALVGGNAPVSGEENAAACAEATLLVLTIPIEGHANLLKHIKPAMVAGHSLGEYSALVVAGAIAFEDALRLVRLRGELMQKAGEEQPFVER